VCKTVANGLLVYLLVSYLDSVLMEMVLDFLGRETDAGSNAHRHAVFRRVMGTRQRESSNPAPDYGEFRRFSLSFAICFTRFCGFLLVLMINKG